MNDILAQQQRLLEEKLRTGNRLQSGLAWPLDRLPDRDRDSHDVPAVTERAAAIVDRFCKLQDHLAGCMRHAHAMLDETFNCLRPVFPRPVFPEKLKKWALTPVLTGLDYWLLPIKTTRKLYSTMRIGREALAKSWPMEHIALADAPAIPASRRARTNAGPGMNSWGNRSV